MKVNTNKLVEGLLKESKVKKGFTKETFIDLAYDIDEYPEEYPTKESIIEYVTDLLNDSVDCSVCSESNARHILSLIEETIEKFNQWSNYFMTQSWMKVIINQRK